MSSMKDKSAETKPMMDNLQDELDLAVFEEDMDVKKVKEILDKMERIDPDAAKVKKEFNKDLVWQKIQEQCNEEMAEESIVDFDISKANGNGEGRGKDTDRKGKIAKKNSGKVRRIALTAATIVVAVFVGANIGTYATEKKNVIEYMQDLKNGTSFWVTGDAPSMEVEQETEIYYSWNDVPNEYKEFLVIPQGLPEDMGLYDIKVATRDTVDEVIIRYLDEDAKRDFVIQITANQNEEFTFANLMYEEEYNFMKEEKIEDIELFFYSLGEKEVIAQFIYNGYFYTISGTIDLEEMQNIMKKTIELNF